MSIYLWYSTDIQFVFFGVWFIFLTVTFAFFQRHSNLLIMLLTWMFGWYSLFSYFIIVLVCNINNILFKKNNSLCLRSMFTGNPLSFLQQELSTGPFDHIKVFKKFTTSDKAVCITQCILFFTKKFQQVFGENCGAVYFLFVFPRPFSLTQASSLSMNYNQVYPTEHLPFRNLILAHPRAFRNSGKVKHEVRVTSLNPRVRRLKARVARLKE